MWFILLLVFCRPMVYFCSHQPMERSLSWMGRFNLQRGMNVHTRKWSLIFHFAQFQTWRRYFYLCRINIAISHYRCTYRCIVQLFVLLTTILGVIFVLKYFVNLVTHIICIKDLKLGFTFHYGIKQRWLMQPVGLAKLYIYLYI